MSGRLITIHSDNPKIRFENQLDLDALQRTMERVMAMKLERLYGVPYAVTIRISSEAAEESKV